jgi:hypothetical protein
VTRFVGEGIEKSVFNPLSVFIVSFLFQNSGPVSVRLHYIARDILLPSTLYPFVEVEIEQTVNYPRLTAYAQYPPYRGAYLPGFFINSARFSLLENNQLAFCHLYENILLPFTGLPSVKYATGSNPFIATPLLSTLTGGRRA